MLTSSSMCQCPWCIDSGQCRSAENSEHEAIILQAKYRSGFAYMPVRQRLLFPPSGGFQLQNLEYNNRGNETCLWLYLAEDLVVLIW